MKKWKTIMVLSLCVNMIPLLGFNIAKAENGTDMKDTFRIYVTKPLKI